MTICLRTSVSQIVIFFLLNTLGACHSGFGCSVFPAKSAEFYPYCLVLLVCNILNIFLTVNDLRVTIFCCWCKFILINCCFLWIITSCNCTPNAEYQKVGFTIKYNNALRNNCFFYGFLLGSTVSQLKSAYFLPTLVYFLCAILSTFLTVLIYQLRFSLFLV